MASLNRKNKKYKLIICCSSGFPLSRLLSGPTNMGLKAEVLRVSQSQTEFIGAEDVGPSCRKPLLMQSEL